MSTHNTSNAAPHHRSPEPQPIATTTEQPRLHVDLKRSGANTPAELSPGSVNSDPDDGCDKYSVRSGESEVTATVHDDVPETSIVQPHSMFGGNDAEHSSNRPSISTSTTHNGPEATITSATSLPLNKKPKLLNTYMRRVFEHYKVNFAFVFIKLIVLIFIVNLNIYFLYL